MQLRKGMTPLAVAAVALAGTLLTPGTANASSGGGCYTSSAGGDTLESCISASGHYAEPDGYIINNSGCAAAYLDVLTGNEVQVAQYNVGCSDGHKGPFPQLASNGQQFETKLVTEDSDGIVIESLIGYSVTVSW